MFANHTENFFNERSHTNVLVAAFACGMLIGSTAAFGVFEYRAATSPVSPTKTVLVPASDVLAASEPVRIRIPTLGIDAQFEESLGVMESGEIEVPEGFDTVGWYKHSPTPGERGPAVVLGHVDSYEGPEVFHPLQRLEEGDEILIDRDDGSTATFIVTKLENYPQSGFPTELVYGDLDHAGLRLITCSGDFDHGERRYSHNLIVFAVLAAK